LHSNLERVGLPPFDVLNRAVLNQLLDPQKGAPFAMRAVLRTQLEMPAETNASPQLFSTNAPPDSPTVPPQKNPPIAVLPSQ
jgi:hypothetical protein